MNQNMILSHVDHTLLKPYCTWKDIQKLCDEAVKYGTASVCIPPSFVRHVKEEYADSLRICTVIGFPLGYNTTESKVYETKQALRDGAQEVDMVVNIGDVKEHNYGKVFEEIRAICMEMKESVLKVIVETCYLTEDEKIALCECITKAKADFIKTSTGFGTGGATIEDISLFKKHIGKDVKIKAAGGIRTREEMEAFLNEGCERIGASSAIAALNLG